MPYYLLKPMITESRDWRRSAYVGEVQVFAETADDARRRANREYVRSQLQPGFMTPAVPWTSPHLCSVRRIAEPDPALPRLGADAGARTRSIAPHTRVQRHAVNPFSHQIHNHKGEHP